MAKAVLVMDMPECCADCKVATNDLIGLYHCAMTDNYYSIDESLEPRDRSCPLRELPEKKEKLSIEEYEFGSLGKAFVSGWNVCLDEILKERDADETH